MSVVTPVAEHIEESKLYTDLAYRFDYVCKFVGFGEEDINVIKASAPIVAPMVPSIVDDVYVKLFSFDITKDVFLTRNDGFHGKLADSGKELTLDNEQIKFRKDFLGKYLTKLVTAQYNAAFIKYLDYVGKIHTPHGGSRSINVDYIHCNALFGYVADILIAGIWSANIDDSTKQKLVRAFSKLLWIQNDLFAKYYVVDGEQYRPATSTTAAPTNTTTSWLQLNKSNIMSSAVTMLVCGVAFIATTYMHK